jgi:nitroreductase/molybdopterin/thiamine biosynthesis adenylyltransferase
MSHAPTLFHFDRPTDRDALQGLLAERRGSLSTLDQLKSQVCELIKARSPGQRLTPAVLQAEADRFIEAHGGDTFGCWVFYPWRQMLVRLLPQQEFVELRTSRNQYKITSEEQGRLSQATIGVVGLSAGNAIAVCLALERIGGTFRLADHDSIELSNMNRVACGVTVLGLNKAVITARQLYEIDPYLRIELFDQGVQPGDLPRFLDGPPKLDLLIEECDDLYMKVRLREEARARRIAVIMETNDRGLLDVERFDLEPDRPLLHGLLAGVRSDALKGLDNEGKTPFALRVFGSDMSPRLAASVIEIDKTVTGWPQLGSGNMLGGAIVTDSARRILLGEWRGSGRFRVDLEGLIEGSTAIVTEQVDAAPSVSSTDEEPSALPAVSSTREASREEIAWLVSRAAMAPSGGNDQPWRFTWRQGGALNCYLDRAHSGSFLDFKYFASYLALGAAAESGAIAATGLGRNATVQPFPEPSEPDLVFRLLLGEPVTTLQLDPLLPLIEARATNRRFGERHPLTSEQVTALQDAAHERSADLALVSDPETLNEVGELLGAVDRFRFMSERMHTAMMSELRWSPGEASATRDGIDLATLDLDAVGMAGLHMLANPETASFLRSLGKGERLENSARKAIAGAGAVGLITIGGIDQHAYFQAGRALQRVWLTATRLGLALQPMSVAPYLFLRLTGEPGAGLTPSETRILTGLRQRFASVFQPREGQAQALLFRLTHAPPPSTRALRRRVSAILTEV